MLSPNIHNIRVPPTGPEDAKVMFVGEAPGGDEEIEGEPFVGKSGQFLMRYIGRLGLQRSQVYLTNLSKFRPKKNDFKHLIGTPELEVGLAELSEEIERVNPNIIVALGNWPMYYLTLCTAEKGKPGSGIFSWRGSVVEGQPDYVSVAGGRKVLCTFHPAFIVRPKGFENHPTFFNDLKRIKFEQDSPEFNYPKYDLFVDPPEAPDIARSMMESDWLTVDIETFGESLACVGFADSTKRALVVLPGKSEAVLLQEGGTYGNYVVERISTGGVRIAVMTDGRKVSTMDLPVAGPSSGGN